LAVQAAVRANGNVFLVEKLPGATQKEALTHE
jgi:hypothetical protein